MGHGDINRTSWNRKIVTIFDKQSIEKSKENTVCRTAWAKRQENQEESWAAFWMVQSRELQWHLQRRFMPEQSAEIRHLPCISFGQSRIPGFGVSPHPLQPPEFFLISLYVIFVCDIWRVGILSNICKCIVHLSIYIYIIIYSISILYSDITWYLHIGTEGFELWLDVLHRDGRFPFTGPSPILFLELPAGIKIGRETEEVMLECGVSWRNEVSWSEYGGKTIRQYLQ